MTSAFTAAADFRQGLYEAAVTAIGDSDVSIVTGAPSDVFAWDLVAVGREVTSDQDFGPMGTARTRNEQLTCDVTVSVLRPGGQEQESVAATRAYELLGAVELYARKTDTTLGGSVVHCFMTHHEVVSQSIADPGPARLFEITATFTAFARVTG